MALAQELGDLRLLVVVQFFLELDQRGVGAAPVEVRQHSGVADPLEMLPGGLARADQVEVVAQKPDNDQHHDPDNDGAHHDGYHAVDAGSHRDEHEHQHAGEDEHDGHHNRNQKPNKEPVVPFPNTVVHKRTVVIEHLHAVLARHAVAGSLRAVDLAGRAESAVVGAALVDDVGHQVFLVFLVLKHQEGAPGNYPWIGEAGQQDEHQGQHPGEGYSYGQDGAHLIPEPGRYEYVVRDHHDQQAAVVVCIGGPVAQRPGDILLAAESVIAWPELIQVFSHPLIIISTLLLAL